MDNVEFISRSKNIIGKEFNVDVDTIQVLFYCEVLLNNKGIFWHGEGSPLIEMNYDGEMDDIHMSVYQNILNMEFEAFE